MELVVHSTYIKKYKNGTLIHGSKESSFTYEALDGLHDDKFGWIPLKFGCKCTTRSPSAGPRFPSLASPVQHPAALPVLHHLPYCIDGDDGSGRECHKMMIGDSMTAGSLCIEAAKNSKYFEFTFTSDDDWTLLSTEFWLGDSITSVPTLASGEINNQKFPYFWRNSTGEDTWKTNVTLNVSFDCAMIDEFKLAVVASSTYGKVAGNGTLIEDSEVIAFLEDHSDDEKGFGWFNLGLHCNCNKGGPLESLIDAVDSVFGGNSGDAGCVPSSVFVSEDLKRKARKIHGKMVLLRGETTSLTSSVDSVGIMYQKFPGSLLFQIPQMGPRLIASLWNLFCTPSILGGKATRLLYS